jgi:hypothetical protein
MGNGISIDSQLNTEPLQTLRYSHKKRLQTANLAQGSEQSNVLSKLELVLYDKNKISFVFDLVALKKADWVV